ncbi:MAG: hypothetical protein LBQ09_11345, partial [Acidobacteriaceae bacterium]|nr:hypothetical protein [Acidobacteriaceae bacterium]
MRSLTPKPGTRPAPQYLAVLALALSLAACQQAGPAQRTQPVLRVSLAFPPFGEIMASEFKRTLPNLNIQSVTAPETTVDAIPHGLVDWGVERADLVYQGYRQQLDSTPAPQQIRGIALLQPLPLYFLVRPGSGIKQVADLRHANIATGPANTSSYVLAQLLLKAADITTATLIPITTRARA